MCIIQGSGIFTFTNEWFPIFLDKNDSDFYCYWAAHDNVTFSWTFLNQKTKLNKPI